MDDGIEVAGLAIVLQRLANDQRGLFDYLAGAFATALPDSVRVKRKGLFNTGDAINIEVLFPDLVLDLRTQHGHVAASTGPVVGGVVLSHTPCTIDEWISQLLRELNAAAARSEQVRAALARLAYL
jgi:hypothetical protein